MFKSKFLSLLILTLGLAVITDSCKKNYDVAVESISLSETSKELSVNESFTLTAKILPEDASDKTIIWSSNNEEVATVNSEGKVTAISVGKATINAETKSNKKIASCEITVIGNSIATKKITKKDVKDYGMWYYFSFEKGDFVGEGKADPADGDDAKWKAKTDWDIAFHRGNVRTNGGTSGNGQGGILNANSKDFDAIKEVPSGEFTVDKILKGEVMAAFVMPPTYVSSSANEVANDWAVFDHGTMSYSVKKDVYIVKTASGKYVKIQFLNFLNDEDKSGFITLQYAYQADGSTKF